MLEHILSYSLEDFMPMDVDSYLRLLERVNESFWPIHFLTLSIGMLIIVLLKLGYEKLVWPLMGSSWIFSGIYFHGFFYSELNWAAVYFSWGFIIQGLLLVAMFFTARPRHRDLLNKPNKLLSKRCGLSIMMLGVAAYPLFPLLMNRDWLSAETFGVSPDPTCLVTLGLIIYAQQSRWWIIPIPVLWCIIAGATSYSFNLFGGLFLFTFYSLFGVAKLWKQLK